MSAGECVFNQQLQSENKTPSRLKTKKQKKKNGESVMFKPSVKVLQIIRDGGATTTATATLACRADSLDPSSPQGGGGGVWILKKDPNH